MNSGRPDPALAVVLATDRIETIRPVLVHLRRQTVRDRLEIVLVTPPAAEGATFAELLDGFAVVRRVELDSVVPLSRAREAGVRAATAPLVYIGETHSYAHPDCMETFLRAHAAEDRSVVVPGFVNANPRGIVSWASFVLDYGTWWEGLRARRISFAPCYNVTARRDVFLGFGDRLERVFAHGDEFLQGLRERDATIWFEPGARVSHLNASTAAAWRPRFLVGRVRAADRAATWPPWRRALYVLGSPLIPAVLFWRLRRPLRELRRRGDAPAGTAAVLAAILAVTAFGEMLGYAFGPDPEAEARVDDFEIRKTRYVRPGDVPRVTDG